MEILKYYLWRDKVPFYSFCLLGYLLVIALIFLAPTGNGSLPIRARYPFDTTVSPGHEIGFIVEACSIFIGVTAILAVDSLIISFCNLILLQLEILSMNFQRCTTVKVDLTAEIFDNIVIEEGLSQIVQAKTSRNERYEKYFKTYIRHHQRLVAMIEDINDLFSSSMLVQIFSSTSMICLTGFQAIVISGQDSHLWKYCIYLCAAVSQLLYICWIGNEMITHSSSLAEAQWLSQWHREPLDRTASLLIFSTMFSQKPLRLKAGKFYTLSLETFIADFYNKPTISLCTFLCSHFGLASIAQHVYLIGYVVATRTVNRFYAEEIIRLRLSANRIGILSDLNRIKSPKVFFSYK